jgi:hypothetical protein
VKNRQTILHALLALVLLLSQQAGFAHAVSHFSKLHHQSASQDKELPIEQICEKCLSFTQIGSGLTSQFRLHLSDATSYKVLVPDLTPTLLPSTLPAFRSRAPPTPLS